MSNDNNNGKAARSVQPPATRATTGKYSKRRKPEWADGLRRLYDSVLDEPLPDSFADLLSKLDDGAS